MAKSRAKSEDGPAISMKVEQGRLVPVSQYDLELLNSWREGAILNVHPVLAQVRPLEKRYWAMLGHLLKAAETPWPTPTEAHDAIKQATGFIESYPKEGGEWGFRKRHISTFSDTELSEYFELFCALVQRKFGIDPETLRREAPDIGSSEPVTLVSGEDDSPDAAPDGGVGVQESPTPPNPGEGDEAGGDGEGFTPQTPSSSARLSNADLQWLKTAARMLVAASEPGGDVDILLRQASAIKGEIPGTVTRRARDLLNQVFKHCLHSTRDMVTLDRKLVATLAGCEMADLRPEAR